MAKFCGRCGTRLNEAGFCPNCDAEKEIGSSAKEKAIGTLEQEQKATQVVGEPLSKKTEKKRRRADKKAAKKAKKKEKWAKLTAGQKAWRVFLKLLMWLLLIAVLVGGTIGGLSYLGVLDVPLLSAFSKDNLLEIASEKAIIIEETDIVMETDTRGIATIVVKMPDYEQLFKEASIANNPEQHLLVALTLGQYNIQEFEETATVTVNHGITTIHSEEVVHQLLEEALINAINALSEVE